MTELMYIGILGTARIKCSRGVEELTTEVLG